MQVKQKFISRLKYSFSSLSSGCQSGFYDFPRVASGMDSQSKKFRENKESMDKCLSHFQNQLQQILAGGPKKDQENLIKRNKLQVRERINKILDVGSPFLELSQFAGYEMYGDELIHSGGIISGIGQIQGKFCMIVANDPAIKGGTYYPITIKKHLRAQEIAKQNKLPCVYLVDSGGANLPRQDEVFPDKEHFGRIFFNQANMSAQGIPQISVVLGSCTAGGAYVPAMSDENIIVKENGTIFLGGPPLVKAATGEVVSAQDLGGADVHCGTSGVTDHYANNEIEALQIARNIIQNVNSKSLNLNELSFEEPIYDQNELNYVIHQDLKRGVDVYDIIARVFDGSKLLEFKKNYGPTLITGFAKLYGQDVGVVANNGILFSEAALKGAHFIEICSQRKIPLIFLQNITGFMVGKKYESEGIAKNGAKLVSAVSTTQVPKLTLIFGGSFGAGNYGMCGRAYDPRFMFTWPNSKISVMGGDQAAGVMATVQKAQALQQKRQWTDETEQKIKQTIIDKFDKESSSYYASARLWDDGMIMPSDTRKILGLSLLIAKNTEIKDTVPGIFRM